MVKKNFVDIKNWIFMTKKARLHDRKTRPWPVEKVVRTAQLILDVYTDDNLPRVKQEVG